MRLRMMAFALVTTALTMTFVTACKTRPLRLGTQPPVEDLSVHDAAPDLTLADLHIDPDLLPPPDLQLPFICRNVYVVDSSRLFSSFDTNTLQFEDLGFISCPTKVLNAQPFSMSVARDGSA